MADDIDLDKPVTAAQAAVILADERTTRRTAPLSYWREKAMVQADGGLLFPAAGGVHRVTEASAATISTTLSGIEYLSEGLSHTFGGAMGTGSLLPLAYTKHRIFSVDLTSDGAGAVAATTIVPALAGYTGHAQLVGVWANATDAATTFTFACAAGTLLGPAVHVLATTAQSVTQFGAAAAGIAGCPVYIRGTLAADDNKALTVAVAGYAATQTMTVFGYYWWET